MLRWTRIRWTGCCGFIESHWTSHQLLSTVAGPVSQSYNQDGLNVSSTANEPAAGPDVTAALQAKLYIGTDGEVLDRAVRARYLLRSILRECTYLPDSIARQWMKQYALQRFRSYTFFAWQKQGELGYEERLRAKEKEARRWIAHLRRANAGHRRSLRKVLFMSFGRVGKKRRELMRPLMIDRDLAKGTGAQRTEHGIDEDNEIEDDLEDRFDAEEDEMVLPTAHKPRPGAKIDASAQQRITPPVTNEMKALITSQMRASPPSWTRLNPRRVDLLMPVYNAWLRPMPRKRVKNKLHKHYAALLDRVLPPLPAAEWDYLFNLASGKQPVEPFPQRRKRSETSKDQNQQRSRHTALEYVVAFGKPPKRLIDRSKPRFPPARWMRRLYAEVLGQVPRMDWDTENNRWKFTWGDQALGALSCRDVTAGMDSSLSRADNITNP